MPDAKNYQKLCIFVAAPSDVAKEREAVHAVAAELNREGNVADQLGVTLKVLDWREVTPNMGRPEQVILDELKVETWDIFVGILWLRFGSPTGGIDPETGRAYDSGTEEEFNLAYHSWQKNKRPRILFYRCTRSPNLDQLDPDQFKRVKEFFGNFDADKNHPGLYQTFQTTEDFERRLRQDLTKLLFEYGEKVLQKSPPPPPPELPGDDLTKHYLDFVRNQHGKIKLFGFLSHANIDVRLLDVFVSLRFSEHWRELEMKRLPAPGEREDRALSPPQVLQRAMQKKKTLLILGGPGSGKTTLLKYFAICCLDADSRNRIQLQRPLIPIFVPLRQIDPTKPFTEALAVWAKTHNQNISAENFTAWLHNPGALVLLDGLDEVSDLKTRRLICEWIDKAAPAFGESTFVVTCRFTGYREAEGVALQTPHTRADVLDLNHDQQRTFLQQWFRAAELERLENHELNDPVRLQEIQQAAQTQAQAIMEFLGKKENRSLADMAGIPVLLQIMAIIWRERGSLSSERVELYNCSIDYLLEHRDRTKNIEPLLSAAKARLVLQPLALWLQKDQKKDEASAAEVENQIAAKLQEVRPGTPPSEFLENIRDRAGVLVGSGAETYTFQHKSFREFLAAIEIASLNAANVLVENFGDDWWRETALFAAGLSRPVIFPAFLENFLKHDKNDGPTSPLYLQMLQEAAVKPLAPFEKVLRDKRLSWQKRYNALQGVRLLRSEAAKELVKFVHGDKEPRLRQAAEAILIEWSAMPAPTVITPRPDRFFNPLEDNAEYILIRGGAYQFSGKKVTVPDMYFAKFPVTNKRYRIFLNTLPQKEREDYRVWETDKRFLGDDQPVMTITWYAAMAYCDWLTERQKENSKQKKESLVFRLPTEIEWEWAATGGKRIYPWGNEKPDETRANYGRRIGHTTPVGSYPAGATPEGLMDMAGNVWEWCLNGWGKPDFVLGEDRDLLKNWRKIKSDDRRALRGGSYYTTDLGGLRGSGRDINHPDNRNHDNGFRVCVVGES